MYTFLVYHSEYWKMVTRQNGILFGVVSRASHATGNPLSLYTTPSIFVVIMSDKEQNVQNALSDFYCKCFWSIRQCALYNGIALTTMAYPLRGPKGIKTGYRRGQEQRPKG